jgi:hypothetical protein
MDLLHRSFSKLTHLCVNQDAKIATIRAVIVATILAGLLILLMNLSETDDSAGIAADANGNNAQAFVKAVSPGPDQASNAQLI